MKTRFGSFMDGFSKLTPLDLWAAPIMCHVTGHLAKAHGARWCATVLFFLAALLTVRAGYGFDRWITERHAAWRARRDLGRCVVLTAGSPIPKHSLVKVDTDGRVVPHTGSDEMYRVIGRARKNLEPNELYPLDPYTGKIG